MDDRTTTDAVANPLATFDLGAWIGRETSLQLRCQPLLRRPGRVPDSHPQNVPIPAASRLLPAKQQIRQQLGGEADLQ
jgi:hypothetical protein